MAQFDFQDSAENEDSPNVASSSTENTSSLSMSDSQKMFPSKPFIYPGQEANERIEAVSRVLTTFLHTDTWDETFTILTHEQSLLLTDIAERLLGKMIRKAKGRDIWGQDHHVLYLMLHLHLLHQSRILGIANGWKEFEVARLQIEQSQKRSLKERGVPLSYADAKRAAYDPYFLAEELRIPPDSPNIPALQEQLRDFLHSSEYNTRIKVEQTPGMLIPLSIAENDSSQLTQQQIALSLLSWLGASDHRQSLRYLQAHSELLDPRTQTILETLITVFPKDAPQVQQKLAVAFDQMPPALQNLRDHLGILRTLSNAGSVSVIIEAAYVNIYGGLALEVPSWLEEVEVQVSELETRENAHETAERRVALLYEAIARVKRDVSIGDEIQAELKMFLFKALDDTVDTKKPQAQEEGIAYLKEACQVYSLATYPRQYARVQFNLGNAYQERIAGERKANLEEAIACFSQALRIYTPSLSPKDYAAVLNGLGVAYSERIAGERRANLEEAIACFSQALHIYTLDTFPQDYAIAEINLGATYRERIEGEKRANLEESIASYIRALQVYIPDDFPQQYALVQNNLGNIYMSRIMGEKQENQKEAIAHFTRALRVFSLSTFPLYYAQTQNNLGVVYLCLLEGTRRNNLENAIECFNQALQVYTIEVFPAFYARTLLNLCEAYADRIVGNRRDNLEQAIVYSEHALQIITMDTFPEDYAVAQMNLGDVYRERIVGIWQDNLEQAIVCYQRALQIYTLHAFPHQYQMVQLRLAYAEADRQNWDGMHRAYQSALEAEELLVVLGAGVIGQDAILKNGGDAAVRDGFALVRLSRISEAAMAIERGRTRELAASIALETANPSRISSLERRTRYEEARNHLITTQSALYSPIPLDPNHAMLPNGCAIRSLLIDQTKRTADLERTAAYHQAKAAFDSIVNEIRAEQDPGDFLETAIDPTKILQSVAIGDPSHALVYLAYTPWGGFAVAALGADPIKQTEAHFAAIDLPHLTSRLVRSLIGYKFNGEDSPVISGFIYAQEGSGLQLLLHGTDGETLREKALNLDVLCTGRKEATLNRALQMILTIPRVACLADQPLNRLSHENLKMLEAVLGHLFMQYELERCLSILTRVALRSLVQWLQKNSVTSVTLVPCGWLAAFPLAAAEITPGQTMGDLLTTSFAPSARSLLRERYTATKRSGFYTLGDPHPTPRELQWSEAEAQTLVQLARRLGLSAEGRVHFKATRDYLIDILRRGYVVDVSSHGHFDSREPLQSALLLARNEKLTLSDVLSHKVDLRGLRLLMLSACQTSIIDTRGAYEEVRSLATSMLQAGAEAVLASLWQVDDKATYLLMVRFAQEWFPRIEIEPPAAALARAQHWLRTVTNRDLQIWCSSALAPLALKERQEAGLETPKQDHGGTEEDEQMDAAKRASEPKRGSRYDAADAEMLVHAFAMRQDDLNACPYDKPIYWAGFQIIGG